MYDLSPNFTSHLRVESAKQYRKIISFNLRTARTPGT